MDQQAEITSIILSSFAAFWETVLGFLPKVIATFLILVVGILLAKAARIVVSRLLQLFRFDQLVEKTGLESYIIGSDYNIRFSGLISGTIYWLIILMMITSIAELLGLQVISDLFEKVVLYLPNIILAMVILIIGTIFSRIVNRYVFNNLKELSMDFALKVALVAEVVVQVFVWFLALEQLQVNTILLLVLFSCLMGAAALAAALAFGLAGKDLAAEILVRSRRGIESGIEEGRK
ncbi:MAG: hypothetical protein ISN26_01640 [Betaproteobacteria bacterium AqS2]|uniref:Uncharacterized protein n=1 Tax=Candidatus Amphirhobacter heronislandensis TaxID=1732024 RepID=A0A930Y0Y4_9GAMM|nr:hypothetical protein [Betaproteobacteria bacterium AqS2]